MGRWGKPEVERLIVERLKPVVAPAGFRYVKKDESFVRAIDGGRQTLGVALWNYNPLFAFSLVMTVRLDAVQAIVNQFSGSPPTFHGVTTTTLTQLEFLGLPAEQGKVEFRASSEAELVGLLPGVEALVRERVVPFFGEYRDLAAINRGLNPAGAERVIQLPPYPDRRAFYDTTNPLYRAMVGVAVARLASDSRWEQLVAAYRAQLAEGWDQDRQKFERLVAHLQRL